MNDRLKYICLKVFSGVMDVLKVFPIRKNTVYVINFTDRGYSDNPKYIVSKLIELQPDVRIFWKTFSNEFPYENIIPVKPHSIVDLFCLSTSKVIISNVRLPIYYKKRKKQFYIETWHGSLALKKIGYDGNNRTVLSNGKIKHFSNYCDVLTSNSKFSTELYRRAFGYNGEIKLTGTPRLDVLINHNNSRYLRDKINISDNEIVVTYAPTFREKGMEGFEPLDYDSLIKQLEKVYQRPVKLLFRLHPTRKMNLGDTSKGIIVTDDVMDVYETLSITDVLISDYSSLVFEFMVTLKPVILYVPDIESYVKTRGLYFDIKKLPFIKLISNSDIATGFDINISDREVNLFIEKLGVFEDGKASGRVAELIKGAL